MVKQLIKILVTISNKMLYIAHLMYALLNEITLDIKKLNLFSEVEVSTNLFSARKIKFLKAFYCKPTPRLFFIKYH